MSKQRWRIPAILLYLFLHALILDAFAFDAITAPLDSDITLKEAQDSFDSIMATCRNPGRCLDQAVHAQMAECSCPSPFHTTVGANICDEHDTFGLYYYWAPVERFQDGPAAFRQLLNRAHTGEVFNDSVIVQSPTSTTGERHLALCDVVQVDGVAGPPRNCVAIALLTPSSAWLRGGSHVGDLQLCYAAAELRIGGAIDITFNVLTGRSPSTFSTVLLGLLRSGLGLEAEQTVQTDKDGQVESVQIRSTSGLRDSRILSAGWREAMDFDVDVFRNRGSVDISGVVHALVARQALASLPQYQGLDDAQRGIYATTLNSKVNSAIRHACAHYRQIDAKTISCD